MQMQSPIPTAAKPLLDPQPPQGDEERVEAVFNAIRVHLGYVPDSFRLYSFSPRLLESLVDTISYFNSGERLSHALVAVIRYLISSNARCGFCIDLNENLLAHMGLDLGAVRKARTDVDVAPLPDKDKLLLKLALKSVEQPDHVDASDIAAAKAAGWSERDIFDAVAQATSTRAMNNLLRAFKVQAQGVFCV